LLALALYAVTLGGTYVYDDRYIVLGDPRISNPSRWGEFWTKDYFNGGADNLYRPLVSLTYAIQWWLHGNSEKAAWAFHAVNILLHAAVSAAVAEFTRRATRSTAAAFIAGLLFAAHPIHVEVIANIIGRAETMCALGAVGALILFLRPLTIARVLAIWACMVLAILSKEQGLLVPLMLLLALPLRKRSATVITPAQPATAADQPQTDVLPYAQPSTPKTGRFSGPTLLMVLLVCWTLAGYIIFRESILKFWWDRSFLDRTINPIVLSVGRDRLLMPLVLLGRYVALLIAPVRLALDYGGGVIGSRVSFADPYLYIGTAAAVVMTAACGFAYLRRHWLVLFCVISFALLFGMVANVATLIGTNFGERLMYLPSVFFCVLAGTALSKLPRRLSTTITAIVLLLFSVRSVTYAARWNDPPALFRVAIAEQPKAIRVYLLLAEDQFRQGDLTAAIKTLATARDLDPNYYRVWLNSAHLAMHAQDFESALRFARKAQQLAPTVEGERLIRTAAVALQKQRVAATTTSQK
jgi:hypothetical protein